MRKDRLKRAFFIAAGFTAVAIGVVGIALPLLPTTPFLLLAAACFFRGSDSIYQWFIHHRVFGKYIRSYREFHAVSQQAKISAILALWICICFSAYLVRFNQWLVVFLFATAIGVTIHIARLRTLTREILERTKG